MKALIIDDERLARQELRTLLKAHSEIEVVDECANAQEALAAIKKHSPELLFLDIQMPGKSGFELLKEIEKLPRVIFITAYDDFAIKAFEINALDYLLKPVEPKRLANAITKALKTEMPVKAAESQSTAMLEDEDQVFVKDGEKCWFVKLSEIRLFESEGNYARVYFKNNRPLILRSLNSLDERLNHKTFYRANRKHIINLKWVDTIENWFSGGLKVKLKEGGEEIEISRRQAARLRDLMSL